MIKILRKNGIGCHLIKVFVGCILFADDLALLAPSRSALQKMIDLCTEYCNKYCLDFNSKKSKIMVFGKSYSSYIAPLSISGSHIEYVKEWKYLGTTLVSGKRFSFTARPDLSSFFRAANAVLNVLTGAQEQILLKLLYTNCVPILTYACAVKRYNQSDMSDCSVAMNNVFRKIFGLTDYRGIRDLRETYSLKSLQELFDEARDRFTESCQTHQNPIVKFIAKLD